MYNNLNNQACIARPTLLNLKPDELHYSPFMVSLDICDGSRNTVEDPSRRICGKTKYKQDNKI